MKNFAWLGLVVLLAGCPEGSSGADAPVADTSVVDSGTVQDAPIAVLDAPSGDAGPSDGGGPVDDAGSDAGAENPDAGEVVCGGRAGATCSGQAFCDFPDLGCDFADGMGLCAPRPVACPDIFMPVCGCDGVTYDNACAANAAGTDAATLGPCL